MTKNASSCVKYVLYFCLVTFLTSCSKSSPLPAHVKRWTVSTIAGSSIPGFKDGDTTQVQFNNPQSIITDNNGSLFVADVQNLCVRQVTYAGHVTTYAGNIIGNPNPPFFYIYGLVRDNQGNLYTSEALTLIRKIISPNSNVILAGSKTEQYIDGTGSAAGFEDIGNMAIDNQNNIFVTDYDQDDNFHLRKVTPGGITSTLTLQDNTGVPRGYDLKYLSAIAIDASGNIYVTANANSVIKKVDAAGNVTVLAGNGKGYIDGKGTAALFNNITGMVCDAAGNLWVCDADNLAIRKVAADGTVTTIAGTGQQGYLDGDGTIAKFAYPYGITIDNSGTLYVTDQGNSRVRKIEYK